MLFRSVPLEYNIEITFSDEGTGIAPEILENLFKIEHKTVTEGTKGEKGSGLGLIITKEFIDKHNGTIKINSEVGKGCRLIITIPLNYTSV